MPKNKDGYYRATFVTGENPNGKPERVTIRAKTKKELDQKLAAAKQLHARGSSMKETLVRDWSQKWLSVYKANASDGQKIFYERKLKLDVLPRIGHMKIREVRSSHLQEMLNSYTGGKKSTVHKIRLTLKQLFADAEVEGLVERNPAARLELPALTEDRRRPITPFEKAVVFNVAQTHKHGVYVLTMLFCGLRRGEAYVKLKLSEIEYFFTYFKPPWESQGGSTLDYRKPNNLPSNLQMIVRKHMYFLNQGIHNFLLSLGFAYSNPSLVGYISH